MYFFYKGEWEIQGNQRLKDEFKSERTKNYEKESNLTNIQEEEDLRFRYHKTL